MPNLPKIFTATADENGIAHLNVDDPGLYTVQASIDSCLSDTDTVDITIQHASYTATNPFITFTIKSVQGNTITITDGTTTLTKMASGNPDTWYIPNTGTWTVSTVIEGETKSKTINATQYTNYSASLLPVTFVTRTVDFSAGTSTLDESEGLISEMAPFIGRRRCNLADDGTINAWYGDANYAEDGSNGQVMVYQPKFYYKVTPITLDGVKIRKASWSIADNEMDGYKLHPWFYDEDGNEIDYAFLSAYEGCVYDTSASTYDKTDSITHDYTVGTGDKLSSIADTKPASGYNRSLTRANARILASNRGAGWHQYGIMSASANQMLMWVEYGGDMQTLIGRGVVDLSSGSYNGSSITGSTSSLGNTTGRASTTYNSTSGTGSRTAYTTDGKTSITYRGMENPYGNIYDFVDGINMYGNQPYICTNYNWAESTSSGDYVSCGFTLPSSNYITAFGYNATYDWLLLPAESSSSGNSLIGDYTYTSTSSSYYIAYLGGYWSSASHAGAFFWSLAYSVDYSARAFGARTTYIPQSI